MAAVILAAALVLPGMVSSRDNVRSVLIVARAMTYYVDGTDGANPSLRFKAGERIRLTFRNEDQGMEHDFTIPGWNVGTKVVNGKGQDVVEFVVPSRGDVSYSCTPHSQMMNGVVQVK